MSKTARSSGSPRSSSTTPTPRPGPSRPGAASSRPPRKTLVSPWTVAHKSTIYSPKRILTPLKRVDFDPNGERNIQNRGVSGYEPISWDEALDMVAEEIIRVKREFGPGGHADHAQLAPHVGQRRLPVQRLLPLHEPGRLHLRRAQPRQLGGLAVGRHPHVGQQPPAGHPRAVRPARRRAQEHRDDRLLVVGPRDHSGRLRWLREHRPGASGSRSSGSRWCSSTPTSTTPPA